MSTPASPTPDGLRHDHDGVDDVATPSGSPTGPGPDSTDASSPTAGSGQGAVNAPDTGPGPAASDVNDGDGGADRV